MERRIGRDLTVDGKCEVGVTEGGLDFDEDLGVGMLNAGTGDFGIPSLFLNRSERRT